MTLLLLCANVSTPEQEFVHTQSEDYIEHVQVIENAPTGTPAISEAVQSEETPMFAEQVDKKVRLITIS